MRVLKFLLSVLCASAIYGAVAVTKHPKAVMDCVEFNSVSQAVSFFTTNYPAAGDGAYKYVENMAVHAKGSGLRKSALEGLRTMSASAGLTSRYETFCLKNAQSCTNEVRKAEWFVAFARTPSLSKDPKTIANQLEEFLSQRNGLPVRVRLEIVKVLSEIYVTNMSETGRGVSLLERFIEELGSDGALKASAMAKLMDVYRKVGRDAESEDVAKQLICLASCPDTAFASASAELARLSAKRGDVEHAGDLLASAIERCSYLPNGFPLQLIKVKVGTNAVNRAITAMRRKIASVPIRDEKAFRLAIERWQPDLITLLTYCGHGDEALGECRIWVFFAPQTKYQSAVELTAKTMKAVDGSLGRAVAFMNFQRKGVVPKGRNPMMEVARLDDPVRKSVFAGLSRLQGENWSDLLALSRWMLWLDDPYASVEAALAAFSVAPFNETALQSCANSIMRPVLAATRNPAAARQIVDFLMHGERGKDGMVNTADDVRHPLDAFGETLRTGGAR